MNPFSIDAMATDPTKILRTEERLRQERETFDQTKLHTARWFNLRLCMGYIAACLLPTVAVACGYILFQHEVFPTSVVVSAGGTVIVDVLGLGIISKSTPPPGQPVRRGIVRTSTGSSTRRAASSRVISGFLVVCENGLDAPVTCHRGWGNFRYNPLRFDWGCVEDRTKS